MTSKLIIHTDGGARGNPGPAGLGVVINDEKNNIVATISDYIGVATNNQAEYAAVLAALNKAVELQAEEIIFYLDSELVVKQLRGEYKVKDVELGKIFIKIYNLSQKFKKITYHHVYREDNKQADALVNQAIDHALLRGE